jgi:type IV secretory pathway VirB2 component (pilin)
MKTFNRMVAVLGVLVTSIFGFAAVAMAQAAPPPADPSAGAYTQGIDQVKSTVSGTYAGPLFLLLAVVVGIGVGLAWLRRAKSTASA